MLALPYLGLIIFIFFIEFSRKKDTKVDFFTLFNIIYTLLYPMPAFFLEANLNNSSSELMFNSSIYRSNFQTAIAIFAGYFTVLLGFYSTSSIRAARCVRIEAKSSKSIRNTGIFLLVLSCTAIQIYSLQYGSFVEALSQAMLIRSNAVEGGSLVFVKHFILISFFSSYVLAEFATGNTFSIKKFIEKFLFIASIIVSILGTMLLASRTTLVYYIICLCLGFIAQGKKISLFLIIPVLLLIPLFILYGKPLFFSLSGIPDGTDAVVEKFMYALDDPNASSGEFSLIDLIGNFVFPIHSLEAALNTKYEWRLFTDWVYGIIGFLPEKVFNITIPLQVNEYNTSYLMGNVSYDIPPGLLAYCVYSMSWGGIFIICFAYGWIARYLQTVIYAHFCQIPWMSFLYYATAQVWVDFQPSGSPGVYMQNNIWYLISFFFLFLFAVKISISSQPHYRRQIR